LHDANAKTDETPVRPMSGPRAFDDISLNFSMPRGMAGTRAPFTRIFLLTLRYLTTNKNTIRQDAEICRSTGR
jgi:hypothetical protein